MIKLFRGDCLEMLGRISCGTVDALVTDPPYGLSEHGDIVPVLTVWLSGKTYVHGKKGFMGKAWERRGRKPDDPRANTHPTVKPLKLMRYLCRLITPPGGVVLDPFAGSGSTGVAAIQEGFKFTGIERERSFFDISKKRLQHAYEKRRA